jgi:hypothetical protein
LPEPSDAWIPRYTELGEVTARVLPHVAAFAEDVAAFAEDVAAFAEDVSSERHISLQLPHPAQAIAL